MHVRPGPFCRRNIAADHRSLIAYDASIIDYEENPSLISLLLYNDLPPQRTSTNHQMTF